MRYHPKRRKPKTQNKMSESNFISCKENNTDEIHQKAPSAELQFVQLHSEQPFL